MARRTARDNNFAYRNCLPILRSGCSGRYDNGISSAVRAQRHRNGRGTHGAHTRSILVGRTVDIELLFEIGYNLHVIVTAIVGCSSRCGTEGAHRNRHHYAAYACANYHILVEVLKTFLISLLTTQPYWMIRSTVRSLPGHGYLKSISRAYFPCLGELHRIIGSPHGTISPFCAMAVPSEIVIVYLPPSGHFGAEGDSMLRSATEEAYIWFGSLIL